MPRRDATVRRCRSQPHLFLLSPPGAGSGLRGGSRTPIRTVECVARIPRLDRRTWLITSTTHLEACCARAITSWRRRRAGFLQILTLDEVAGRSACLGRPGSLDVTGITLDGLMDLLSARGYLDDARRAWSHPPELPAAASRTRLESALLALINRPTTAALTVRAAARSLDVTPRRLHRISLRVFGQPPHVLLGLGRVRAVARALISRSDSLERIAEEHGFPDPGTMSRFFFRYAGIRPGAYRKRATAPLSDRAIDRDDEPS